MFELDLDGFQNAVVVDAAALSEVFYGYRASLSPMQLQDLFNLIDQIVLRDRLIVTGGARLLSAGVERELDLWSREGALWLPKSRVKPLQFKTDRFGQVKPESMTNVERSRVVRSVGRLAGAERQWEAPGMPLGGQRHFYDEITALDLERHPFGDLVAKFRHLAAEIEEQSYNLATDRPLFITVEVPPLALNVFRRIDRIEQLHEVALEVRHQYRDLRLELRNLVELLRDRTKTNAEKRQEVGKWNRLWKQVASDDIGISSYNFKIGPEILPKAVLSILGFLTDSPSGGLATLLDVTPLAVEIAWAAYRDSDPGRRLMRPVYTTLGEHMSMTQRDRREIVSHVVGRQLKAWQTRDRLQSRYGARTF